MHESANHITHDRAGGRSRCEPTDSSEAYTLQLLRIANTVANSMSTLMTMIIDASVRIRQDVRFNNVVQTTSLLIGVKGPSQVAADEPSGISCTQRLAAEAPRSMEWQNNIKMMAEVFDEKTRLEEHLGDPSFSLGMTQLLNEVGCALDLNLLHCIFVLF